MTCFDANFDEVWQEAERKGAEIVLWPSAYGGGIPLNGYAMIHNYYIVAVGQGNMIDIFGRTIQDVEKPRDRQFIATLDLDQTIVHMDFNEDKIEKLLKEHKDEIELVPGIGDMENWKRFARSNRESRSASCASSTTSKPFASTATAAASKSTSGGRKASVYR